MAEEQDLERLKVWWHSNGLAVVGGIVIGLAVVIGINLWKSHKIRQADSASTLYDTMVVAHDGGRPDAATTTGEQLMDQYQATPYAAQAALYLARIAVEAQHPDQAQTHLRWVMEHAGDPLAIHVARLRLAILLIDQGQLDDAEAELNVKAPAAFASQYAELKGDIAAARGAWKEAGTAYEAALDSLLPESRYRNVLVSKLENANGRMNNS